MKMKKSGLEGTPWDDTPASEEELKQIYKEIKEDEEKPESEALKQHMKNMARQDKILHNYGDDDQNEMMSIIDELRLE